MKKVSIIITIFLSGILFSCQNNKTETTETVNETQANVNTEIEKEWVKIDPTEIPDNVIKLISEDWMLITAGNKNSFNTMTASWGTLGEIWNYHVSMIAVRDIRYTYEFLESNDNYTLSFFEEEYRDALTICGTKSGRDTDKIKESNLTPKELESGSMSFEEARLIIECRKLYAEPLNPEAFIDKTILTESYGDDTSTHTLYFGEIINVWIKR